MPKKLRNDATAPVRALVYQFYVALEKCFDLKKGEKVYIETFGDVTVSNRQQIEVKDYSDCLTDMHDNLWNTLKNWLAEGFDATKYQDLILLTRQRLGVNSTLKNWNAKNAQEKFKILSGIQKKHDSLNRKSNSKSSIIAEVLSNSTRKKLFCILGKFILADESENRGKYYENLKDKYCKGIVDERKDDFINALVGYITSPSNIDNNSWEISFDDFSNKVKELTIYLTPETVIFPKKNLSYKASGEDIKKFASFDFIKKVKEIEYDEVIGDVVSEYLAAKRTIFDDLSNYQFFDDDYDAYEDTIHRTIVPKFRKASRNVKPVNLIKESKNFFDEVTSSSPQKFSNFNDTPLIFRNGMIHIMADEKKSIKWKLEPTTDE